MLSDDVLLEIFHFCQETYFESLEYDGYVEDWQVLVHVCHRWRQVVFASPLRLDLRILCNSRTPARKRLDIWPTFPLLIEDFYLNNGIGIDNIIAALEHPHRVSAITLDEVTGPMLVRTITVMQEPFPALEELFLYAPYKSNDIPVLPSEFLGRSAPCLRTIQLEAIPFPGLPVLLLSTSNLLTLSLMDVPQTGYFPPEAMVAALATLTRLEFLDIGFRSPASRPDQIRLPPITRTVLPVLHDFYFGGVREYLEDFVARIDAPWLRGIWIYYFNQLVDFEIPQLWQFIDRSEDLNQPMCCLVHFRSDCVSFSAGLTTGLNMDKPESDEDYSCQIKIQIRCKGIDWQFSHLAQALNQISTASVISNILHFAIDSDSISCGPEDMDDIEWLQLLRPFSSVQTLFVSRELAGHVSRSLENTAATMVTEVLPALDMLCLEGQPMTFTHKFISARWESGHSVTTVDTKRAFQERLKLYLQDRDTVSDIVWC